MSPKIAIGILISIIAALIVVNRGVVFGNDYRYENRFRVAAETPYQSIAAHIQMHSDRDGELTLNDLTRGLHRTQFSHIGSPTVNLGYSDSAYWFRIMLENIEEQPVDVMLEIPYPILDNIEGFITSDSIQPLTVIETFKFGDQYNFDHRPMLTPSFVQPLTLQPGSSWLFLRVKTASSMHLPLYIADDQSYAEYVTIKQWLSGILYGIALALACYNFMLFSALRDKVHLFYGAFLVSLFLFYASIDGYAFWLWPENTSWQSKAHIYFIYLSLALAIEFSRLFLSVTKKQQPVIKQHLSILIALCAGGILVTPYIAEVYAATLMSLISAVCLVYVFCVGLIRLRDGVPMAGLYVVVWGMLIVTSFMNLLASQGLLFDFMAVNGYMKIASVFELFLLSFGLGSKLNTIRNKQIRAEQHALHFSEEARRAEKRALEVEREANKTLEEKVKSRTGQLEEAMQELHKANKELQRLSDTDGLTGLFNRRKFETCLHETILKAHNDKAMVVFMLIDIDYFKKFNDQYGHDMGDLCLQNVATCLSELAGKFGFSVARFGGEEFAVTTVVSKINKAAQLAEIIRTEIEMMPVPGADDVQVTVSIGCHAEFDVPMEERSRLMKQADLALYRAKANGRNCVVTNGHAQGSRHGAIAINSLNYPEP